jgi:hypothetical protein
MAQVIGVIGRISHDDLGGQVDIARLSAKVSHSFLVIERGLWLVQRTSVAAQLLV